MKQIKVMISCLLLLLLCVNSTCSDEDQIPLQINCDYETEIDEDLYNSVVNQAQFSITNVSISEGCLEFMVTSSGCSGDTWEYELVDSGNIAESSPVQRFLKLKFTNLEACLAVVSQQVSFDITNLQVLEENNISLNLEGWGESLSYNY